MALMKLFFPMLTIVADFLSIKCLDIPIFNDFFTARCRS